MSALRNLLDRRRDAQQGQPAQAWYNDLLGGVHWVGDKVLRAFGQGTLSDTLADVEGDALPDQFRTDEQRKARDAALAKKQQDELAAKQQQVAAAHKQAELDTRKAELQQQFAENEKKAQEQLEKIREEQQRTRKAMERLDQETAGSPAHP